VSDIAEVCPHCQAPLLRATNPMGAVTLVCFPCYAQGIVEWPAPVTAPTPGVLDAH
jgi:hypothetical protein